MKKGRKIFVIGFNKTATKTLNLLFIYNMLPPQHGGVWDLTKYNCFSDHIDKQDWKSLTTINNSMFILNTRPVDKWILSRAKHCYKYNKSWGRPTTTEKYKEWILHRQKHYIEVLKHFRDKKEQLIIVDIAQEGWLRWTQQKLCLGVYKDIDIHKIKEEDIDPNYLTKAKEVIQKSFEELGVPVPERSSSYIIKSLLNQEEKEWYEEVINEYKKEEKIY